MRVVETLKYFESTIPVEDLLAIDMACQVCMVIGNSKI